ncbi:hypothetical protein AMJ49_05475 [Parcubacteria bacterium DG_74_2]|nr:MAG: hypothetical protein AMJ49_05475 [Parcubacteria bacterium DG_74_2]
MAIKNNTKIFIIFGLLTILAIAGFFRLWQLETLPGGLFPDEAANGQDAVLILQGEHAPFFERGLGRETLYFYLLAISISVLGIGVWQIHFVSALIGISTVLATWLLAKKLFNNKIAFLTSFFLAASTWHTTLSRTGFRAILIPLLSALFFYFVYLTYKEPLKNKRVLWAILSGISLGLGFYTYIAFRAMIGIIILLAIILFLIKKQIFKKFWREILIGFIAMFLVLSPLVIYFIDHPGSFTGRAGCVSIFNPDLNQGDVLGTFLDVCKKTFWMFFADGDLNWRHNVSGFSMLNPLLGFLFAVFILGSFLVLLREKFWRINDFKNNFLEKYFKYLFLIIWFGAMLGPEILSAQAIPHGLRAIGAIPAVFFFPAIVLNFFWKKIDSLIKSKNSKIFLALCFGILLTASLFYNYSLYFGISANSPGLYYAYRSDLTIVSNYLNQRNLKEKTYLVLDEYSVQTPDYLTIENNQPYILVDPATSYQTKLSLGDQIIFTQSTIFDTKKFKQEHPEAKIIKQKFNKFGQEIMRVYEY